MSDINSNTKMEDIISLAKRRGFVYQGSEIYGGVAGMWDYGPLGVALKQNIEQVWWNQFVDSRDDVYGFDSAILMNPRVWETSGHTEGFTNNGFNEMFKTQIGAGTPDQGEGVMTSYLRPETAQGMFINFKNVVDSFHPELSFGIGQIGKAFRNEISPRDFLFRTREFEQMELEYFVHPDKWEEYFENWRAEIWKYISALGIDETKVHEVEVGEDDRAHYSARTVDFEYDFPFGRKELYGLAYRTDYDLKSHAEASGEKFAIDGVVPHVIEPSLGVDRTILAVLLSAYSKDGLGDGERTVMRFTPSVAPVKTAVFPLLKNKLELVQIARDVYNIVRKDIPQTMWDDNGNIGKRYRRQDEIGTPICITIDFDTLDDRTVTLRDRNTGDQERVAIDNLTSTIKESIK